MLINRTADDPRSFGAYTSLVEAITHGVVAGEMLSVISAR